GELLLGVTVVPVHPEDGASQALGHLKGEVGLPYSYGPFEENVPSRGEAGSDTLKFLFPANKAHMERDVTRVPRPAARLAGTVDLLCRLRRPQTVLKTGSYQANHN